MSHNRAEYGHRKTRCDCCVRAIKWVPVLFILSIIFWSWYAFVIQLSLCGLTGFLVVVTVDNIAEKIILLILYHIIFFLFLWSYYQVVFTDISEVPGKFRLPSGELERLFRAESETEQRRILEAFATNLPITNRAINGAIRFCDKCQLVKPDRAHHCSVCGYCVLKMDHHCPWVNNCVCFNNYKFFILFLGYGLLYCVYIALASLPYFIQFWKGQLEGMGRFHILFLFFVSVMFAISLVSLFGYHIYLVLMNRTTLEAFRPPIFRIGGPDKNGFSLGKLNNFQEVFGDDRLYWFLPMFTSLGDGIQYPVTHPEHLMPTSYESMGATSLDMNSIGDGIVYPVRCMDEDSESLLGSADEQYFERAPFDPYRPRNGRYLALKTYNEDEEYEQDHEQEGSSDHHDRQTHYQNDNLSDRSNDETSTYSITNNTIVVPETNQRSMDHSIIDLA